MPRICYLPQFKVKSNGVYSVHVTLNTVHVTLYTVYCKLYTVHQVTKYYFLTEYRNQCFIDIIGEIKIILVFR